MNKTQLSSLTNGTVCTTTWNESVMMLLDKFFPEGQVTENIEINIDGCMPFSSDEGELAIQMLKSKKISRFGWYGRRDV